MMYGAVPAGAILENPVEYKPSEVPAMTWKGLQVTVENGCVRHAPGGSPFDFLNIGPCSRI